jgi:hypothetical protein
MNTKELLATVAAFVYNIVILAGTAYLVQAYDWNPWWFLFSLLFNVSVNHKKDKE